MKKLCRYACCHYYYHHDPAEGISNCFKIKPSLFLLHTFGHHLEHERLSNFSNFCKTKTLAYFWKTRPPDYFWIEISLFSLPFPFMQEKQMFWAKMSILWKKNECFGGRCQYYARKTNVFDEKVNILQEKTLFSTKKSI